jgi:hypothetical protein
VCPHHPAAMGTSKVEDLRNRDASEVLERLQVLRNTTGRKIKKKPPVQSEHFTVQGVWNPALPVVDVKVTL